MASTINVKIAPLPRGDYSSSATYAKLDVVSYNGSSYMAIKAVPTGTVPTNTTYWQLLAEKPTIGDGSITTDMLADGAVTADKLDSSVSDKYAEVSGTYEDMAVGSAEQLLSTQYDTDSVPYAFRKSPYGDREFDEIVGGSIAWNQLVQNGNFADGTTGWYKATGNISASNGEAEITIGGAWNNDIRQTRNTYNGHVYFLCISAKGDSTISGNVRATLTSTNGVKFSASTPFLTTSYQHREHIAKSSGDDTGFRVTLSENASSYVGQKYYVKDLNIIDLTQMFGSAVADYIYGLETNHTGDGVAFFRGLFPKPYYAYNTGELISVSGLSAHKMTGFNQFSGTLTVGHRWNNGVYTTNQVSNYCASDVVFNCVPNTAYTVCLPDIVSGINLYLNEFDANGTWLRQRSYLSVGTTTYNNQITTSADAYKVALGFYRNEAISQSEINRCNFSVTWDGERDGEYEPYESHSYALDSSLTLRGVPKLNPANEMYFDGDVYKSDGSVQRRYGIVDLGAFTWTYQSSSGNMYAENAVADRLFKNASPAICGRYTRGFNSSNADLGGVAELTTDKSFAFMATSVPQVKGRVVVRDTAYTDATAFKNAMNGVMLVYELATPTTESASPYVNPQICNEYGTEEYVSAEQSGVTMIVGHNTKYPQNLRKKIEGLPWNFSSLIAPTEATNKATRNYTVGSFLIMNNTLYKVTSAIANGGTITVGSNVSATTIMQEILAL